MTGLRAAAFIVLSVTFGCARALPGEDPPAQGFYFPIGIATNSDDPTQPWVYVLSSNFDRRFNAGWVSVIDAAAARGAAGDRPGDPNDAVVQQLKVPVLGGDLAI